MYTSSVPNSIPNQWKFDLCNWNEIFLHTYLMICFFNFQKLHIWDPWKWQFGVRKFTVQFTYLRLLDKLNFAKCQLPQFPHFDHEIGTYIKSTKSGNTGKYSSVYLYLSASHVPPNMYLFGGIEKSNVRKDFDVHYSEVSIDWRRNKQVFFTIPVLVRLWPDGISFSLLFVALKVSTM